MASPKRLAHNYHDGGLESLVVGPRREVVLQIVLSPVLNPGVSRECRLRVADIGNWDEVAAFFRRLPPAPVPDAYLDTIVRLDWTSADELELELAENGVMKLIASKVREDY